MRLVALLALLLSAPVAHADASRAAEPRAWTRLAPTPDALHRERTADLERRIAHLLTALPGVERAELALTLPFPFAEPLDAPPIPARATVILIGHTSRREDALRIVQSAVPSLTAQAVTLVLQPSQARPESNSLAQIGPFRVHPGSAVSLRVWLTISLLANVVLAGIVLSRLRGR